MHQQRFQEPEARVCRVLIAASDHRVRAAIRALVEADGRYSVVAEARTAGEVVVLDQTRSPSLILLDLLFPTAVDGLDAVRLLADRGGRPVVVLSAHEAHCAAAYAAGAAGFVVQGDDADALLTEISAAMSRPPLSP